MGEIKSHMETSNRRLLAIEAGQITCRNDTDNKLLGVDAKFTAVTKRIDNIKIAGYIGGIIASVLTYLGLSK